MAGCTYVIAQHKKTKADILCSLAQQTGSKYCPRHTFLTNIAEHAKEQKDLAAHEKKQQGRGLPQTRAELITRGYQYVGNRECTSCPVVIEWWKTPAGKMAPYNPMHDENSHATSHFATCIRAAQHRRAS